MVFDSKDEQALVGALFTTNLMMKRLAVGFSFFHAGALVESMIFAGTKLRTIGRVLNPYSKKELQSIIDTPAKFKTEFDTDFNVIQKEGLGKGRLIDLAKDGKDFYLQEMKRFFGNPTEYLEANKEYQTLLGTGINLADSDPYDFLDEIKFDSNNLIQKYNK